MKELPIIIKADVQGSAEVLADTLAKLSDDKVKIRIIHSGVGAVTESDVLLGSASKAIIIAFNVRPDRNAEEIANREGNKDAAKAAHAAREELGDVSADELPIKNFDNLSVSDAIKQIKNLKTAHDINVVIRYEETHKSRANVASAAQTQLAALAKEAVGVSS